VSFQPPGKSKELTKSKLGSRGEEDWSLHALIVKLGGDFIQKEEISGGNRDWGGGLSSFCLRNVRRRRKVQREKGEPLRKRVSEAEKGGKSPGGFSEGSGAYLETPKRRGEKIAGTRKNSGKFASRVSRGLGEEAECREKNTCPKQSSEAKQKLW